MRIRSVTQLDLFGFFTEASLPTWQAVHQLLDQEIPGWRKLHPSDLGAEFRRRWSQDELFALYVDMVAERKATMDLVQRAFLRRYSSAAYLAMSGPTARRTFDDEFKRAVSHAVERKQRENSSHHE